MPLDRTNLLQVQLTEAEKRCIKALAASQGLTLRQATLQAFQAWEAHLKSRDVNPARSPRTGAGEQTQGRPKRAAQTRQGQRPSEPNPSSMAAGQLPKPALGWLRRAGQLDWSKCPAAERVPGKAGNVWVVRGTDAPLADILQSIADGHPFLQVAEVFEITLQQMLAVLQFAAEGAAGTSSGR